MRAGRVTAGDGPGRRLLWLAVFWIAGVAAMGAVALALRGLFGLLGLKS